MRCVAKELGLSAQNRHEIGRILQEDGKLHLFILHILLICLNITLEVYNTDNYVENLLQFECSVGMKIERWQLPLFCCIIVVFTSVAIFSTQISVQNERDASLCRSYFLKHPVLGREIQEFSFLFLFSSIVIISWLLLIEENGKISNLKRFH